MLVDEGQKLDVQHFCSLVHAPVHLCVEKGAGYMNSAPHSHPKAL